MQTVGLWRGRIIPASRLKAGAGEAPNHLSSYSKEKGRRGTTPDDVSRELTSSSWD